MAAAYCLACGGCLGGAAFVLSGGGASRRASGWGRRASSRVVRELSVRVGDSWLATARMRVPAWQHACDELDQRMADRDVRVGREGAGGVLLLAMAAFVMALGLVSRTPLGCAVGLMGCGVGVPLWDSSRQRARERALIDEMPEVFRTLAMALGSGETLMQAIEYVGIHERGYAGQAFVNAALRLRCGASADEAMTTLAAELDAPGVGLLTTALVIAQRTGSPLRGLFQSSAELVERQGEYERMLSVKTAQVRLSIRIVCLLPLILVCLLSLISVDFQQGVGTAAGMASVLVATLMDGCALLIIRHLMRGVL